MEYPSPAEGIGLENRQELNGSRGFESLFLRHLNNLHIMEEYPSLAEGTGLENRQGLNGPRGFESLFLRLILLPRDGAVR